MNPALAAALQIAAVVVVLALAYVPLGDYMARVFTSTHDVAPERWFYRIVRVDPGRKQTWVAYAAALLGFSLVSVLFLYVLQRIQSHLPMSGGRPAVPSSMAFNTAVSFVTNTNWQSYSPEAVMGNLTQAGGLAVQNFLSAAVGLAVAVALVRGIVSKVSTGEIGNFWVDLVRGSIRILLPLSVLFAILFLTQGVVQSFHSGFDFTGLDGNRGHGVLGPFASQEAIKELGTNGGGSLATNSAHPFENPTPLSNIAQIIAILIIPVCLTRTYATMVGDRRQGFTILGVMATLFAIILSITWAFEERTNGVAARAAGAMMEGKEQRFGIPASVLYAVATTGTSTGAVNSQHDSFSAAGGGALIWNMLLGEVAPGGVGTGLYGMLVLAIIAVFVGGLLVGRTPEFLGKKIGQLEITMAALSILVMPALVLVGTAITAILPSTTSFQGNGGDPGSPGSIHGYSEILYAFASASNNNGSAFGGLTVTSDWFQIALGVAMLFGRFLPIIFTLALAGLLARQKAKPISTATLPTHGPLYGGLLTGTVLLVAGLTFFPALALGPIAEALA
ncbi:potassium-transporting ATPase subunit KdpA [Williamsia phyllosphaerae]|uniref:Potassium-transporting ATPase potassium-binding subunit n=1 Tax=Williamsia phyllosphaerae TaxID=885042 RepID=A0ABQ1V585_9NOCA|nr:potassium-transporting ATPase subunit KdpA [Williamsia phyllosphaerae]GGF39576.1 potassium-transporting ATPase potassium-binding subunit [Williamsia phyllosphaerae]